MLKWCWKCPAFGLGQLSGPFDTEAEARSDIEQSGQSVFEIGQIERINLNEYAGISKDVARRFEDSASDGHALNLQRIIVIQAENAPIEPKWAWRWVNPEDIPDA